MLAEAHEMNDDTPCRCIESTYRDCSIPPPPPAPPPIRPPDVLPLIMHEALGSAETAGVGDDSLCSNCLSASSRFPCPCARLGVLPVPADFTETNSDTGFCACCLPDSIGTTRGSARQGYRHFLRVAQDHLRCVSVMICTGVMQFVCCLFGKILLTVVTSDSRALRWSPSMFFAVLLVFSAVFDVADASPFTQL